MFPEAIPFTLITMLLTTVSAVWGLAWWLSKQFSAVRNLVFDRTERLQNAIESKLEYHEKHDDERFSQMMNDIWVMRIRAAARDGYEEEHRDKRATSSKINNNVIRRETTEETSSGI